MPVNATPAHSAPTDLAWRVIGLLNLYRLLVPLVLLTVQAFAGPQWALLAVRPRLFLSACIAYFFGRRTPDHRAAPGLVEPADRRVGQCRRGRRWPSRLILYASGGVSSGLGILLVLPVGAMAVLADHRDAFLHRGHRGARACSSSRSSSTSTEVRPARTTPPPASWAPCCFVIALSVWPVANRLRESEALVRRQEVDLANLAQLSQYIVQHLRESILVVDTHDRIRLINESAAQMLGDTQRLSRGAARRGLAAPAVPAGDLAPESGQRSPVRRRDQTFVARMARASSGRTSPRSAASSPAPVLVLSRRHEPASRRRCSSRSWPRSAG